VRICDTNTRAICIQIRRLKAAKTYLVNDRKQGLGHSFASWEHARAPPSDRNNGLANLLVSSHLCFTIGAIEKISWITRTSNGTKMKIRQGELGYCCVNLIINVL
jgi:hypothetical protein